MPAKRYPFVLRERLGDHAYDALVDMVDDRQHERLLAIENRLSGFTDRFDRVDDKLASMSKSFDDRLAALSASFDDRLAAVSASFDDRLAALSAAFDDRLAAVSALFDSRLAALSALFDEKLSTRDARFDHRVTDEFGKVRLEINGLRTEMVAQRAHILKWAMVTWIGQAAAVAAIVAVFR